MTAAVVLLWASCLWTIVQGVLRLLCAASAGQQMAALALAVLTLASCHKPRQARENIQ